MMMRFLVNNINHIVPATIFLLVCTPLGSTTACTPPFNGSHIFTPLFRVQRSKEEVGYQHPNVNDGMSPLSFVANTIQWLMKEDHMIVNQFVQAAIIATPSMELVILETCESKLCTAVDSILGEDGTTDF